MELAEGTTVGRFTLIRRDGVKAKRAMWLCRCECGSEKSVAAGNLRSGGTVSCGCQRKESAAKTHSTHGMARVGDVSPEHIAWVGMKGRCLNKNHKHYAHYGARGIVVCDRWLDSFENFFADMGPRPSPKHSIDRIDVNGNYEPRNCRWATWKEQARNKRNNVRITVRGRSLCAAEIAEMMQENKRMTDEIERLTKDRDDLIAEATKGGFWGKACDKATARAERYEQAIRWALGEVDDFRPRQDGEGAYWWRKELRRRAALEAK